MITLTSSLKKILALALAQVIILVIVIIITLGFLRDSNEEQFQQHMDITSRLFNHAVKDAVLSMDLATLDSFIEESVSDPEIIYMRILSDKVVLAQGGDMQLMEQHLRESYDPDIELADVNDGVHDIHTEIVEDGITYGVLEIGLATSSLESLSLKARQWFFTLLAFLIPLVSAWVYFLRKSKDSLEVQVKSRTIKLEESLEREKELSALTSRFTSMVSHEFRTPLSVVNATSDIILKYADKMSQDDINLRLETIKNEVADMTSMLEDVLIIGKSDAQKLEYNPESLDVVSLVKDIIAGYQLSDADNRDITYHQSSPVIMLTLDKKWIKNIVINLISNAVKYSDKDTAIEVSINEDKAGVSLSFKDYGIGIAQEDIKVLFEPFYRASNVGDIPGTGLGLVVLQKAIDLHNGKIEIESEVGKGSNFIVTLPNV